MENQPTPSTQVNALIELAAQVAEGKAEGETLQRSLRERLDMVVASREDFETKAEAMGKGFTIPNAALIERVDAHYDGYEQAIRTMLGYFESDDADLLQQGSELFIEVTGPMIAVVQEYVQTLLVFGPSPYPVYNATRNTMRAMVEKTVAPNTLEFFVKEAIAQNDQALAGIDGSEHGKSEGWQAKRAAYEAITHALRGLRPVATADDIEPALVPLQSALEAITAADEKIFAETTALAPTGMPAANVLINAARGVINGIYTLELMTETLGWYRDYLEQLEDQFDNAVEGETASVVILEELPKTREIIDEHNEIITELSESLEDFTAETVEPILEDLIDVIERLRDSSEVYMEVAKREGKSVCVVCGHPNPPVNRSCESCGQKLPQLVDPTSYTSSTFELEERSGLGADDDENQGVVTENTLKLFEACYAFYEQKISEADFRAVINWSRSTVEGTDRALASMGENELTEMQAEKMSEEEVEAFEQNRKLFLDSRQVLLEGMEDWSEGLDQLEDYIETRHRPTIELGIQRLWLGSQKLYQVHKVGEIAQRAVADLEAEERANAAASGVPSEAANSAETTPIEQEDSDVPHVDPELL